MDATETLDAVEARIRYHLRSRPPKWLKIDARCEVVGGRGELFVVLGVAGGMVELQRLDGRPFGLIGFESVYPPGNRASLTQRTLNARRAALGALGYEE